MSKNHKLTKKGYFRYAKDTEGKLRFEHCIVWEKEYGKIPIGMFIHHKDFDKENNNILNLELVTSLEHKRIHQGCIYHDEVWYKPCKICGEYKEANEENWYYSRGWINGKICKKCYIKKTIETRKVLIARGWKRKNYTRKNISR